jgi:hypothetical protein
MGVVSTGNGVAVAASPPAVVKRDRFLLSDQLPPVDTVTTFD